MRVGIPILGIAALAVACGGSHETEPSRPNDLGTGSPIQARAEEIPQSVPVEGTVVARNRAEITTRMMARVSDLTVDVGSRVRRGDVLIRLGTEDVAANRTKAEAAVMVAQAARDEAARQAERMDVLLAQDVVPQVQRDQAHLQLTRAEAQLAMATAALQEVETAGSYAAIRAPFAGEVVTRFVDEGDVAAPGMPLLVVEEAGPRDGRLAVPVEAAARLEPEALIRVSTLGGRTVNAPVRVIAGGADPHSKTVEVRVILPEDWPTGVSVTGLVPAGVTRAVTISSDAVVRRGQLTGVRVVTQDGVALRWVRLGRSIGDGARVEVLSGLNAGEEIVLPDPKTSQAGTGPDAGPGDSEAPR